MVEVEVEGEIFREVNRKPGRRRKERRIKEIKEEEKKTKQYQKGKIELKEEEGIGETEDTVEEGEEVEEIYHDAVEEEVNTEEDWKEEE